MEVSFHPWEGFTVRQRGRDRIYETDDEALEAIADHFDDPEEVLREARAEFYES